jgi:hypothetical protein
MFYIYDRATVISNYFVDSLISLLLNEIRSSERQFYSSFGAKLIKQQSDLGQVNTNNPKVDKRITN